jgi:hypothetical protein
MFFGTLKKIQRIIGTIGSGLVMGNCALESAKLRNLGNQIGVANDRCGDLGIAFTATYKNSRSNLISLEFRDFWCQDDPATPENEARPLTGGPFSFEIAPPSTDIAFAIDTTGSMDDDIAAVKSSVASMISGIKSSGDPWRTYRFGVVTYNDPAASLLQGLTEDSAAVQAAVNGITDVSGGGDTPEAVYNGIMTAVNGMSWDSRSTKEVVTLGDAPPHEPDPAGYTRASVAAALNALQGSAQAASGDATTAASDSTRTVARSAATVTASAEDEDTPFTGLPGASLYPVVVGGDTSAEASFRSLATLTGGEMFTASSASGVVDRLTAAMVTGAVDPYTAVASDDESWSAGIAWYGGTGTMAGVRRTTTYARTIALCDDDSDPEYAFAFRLPSAVDPANLRWWALNSEIDQALTAELGDTVRAVGSYSEDRQVALLCVEADAELPGTLDEVMTNLRLSW